MFRFNREKIRPLIKDMTVAELARKAGISYTQAFRAVNGLRCGAKIILAVAEALNIDAQDYLE